MHRFLITSAVSIVFMLLAGCANTSAAEPAAPPPPVRRATTNHNANWNDMPYGVNGFHPNGAAPAGHLTHYFKPSNIQKLRDGEIKWVRLMIDWRYIEPTKGQFVWASLDRALKIINDEHIGISACLYEPPRWAIIPGSDFLVKPEDFGNFGRAIAEHAKGKIAAYEIDNERSTGSWPKVAERSAAVFVPMLKAAYTGIKAGDPQAIVVMNGLWEFPTYYLEDMYRLGAKGYFDVVNIHYYLRMDRDPKYKDPFRGDLDLVLKQVEYVTKKYGDTTIPIWFTEYGWPATNQQQSYPVGEQKMSEYMAYFLEHCRDSGLVEKTFWYVYYMPDGMALWHETTNRKLPAWHTHLGFEQQFPSWANLPIKPIIAPPPASKPADIANADFETDAAWKADSKAKVSLEKNEPESGKQYLHVSTTSGPADVVGPDFALEPGKTYELTGYIRMKGGMENPKYAHAMIHIELLGEGGKSLNLIGPRQGQSDDDRSTNYYIADTGGEWYQAHYFIFTPDTVKGARIILRLGHKDAPAGAADFDEIKVSPVDMNR